MEYSGKEFVELIAYCANKCRATSTNLSGIMRSHSAKLITSFNQVSYLFGFLLYNFTSVALYSFIML